MIVIPNILECPHYCLSNNQRGRYPVEVVEGGPELVHLLLGDALGVPGQDLRLHLVDGPGNGCQQQLPSNPNVLPGKWNDQLWAPQARRPDWRRAPPARRPCLLGS